MQISQHYSLTRFMGFVPKIRQNTKEWWIVDVSLTGKTPHNVAYIAKKMKEYFDNKDGIIFICNSKAIVALAHMGNDMDGDTLSTELHERMPKFSCAALASEANADGLLKVQLRMKELEEQDNIQTASSSLLKEREARDEPVVMIADDDMFMRSLVTKHFQAKGKVLEFASADNLVEAYLEHLPDVVFLDIHLPGGSGMDILGEILSFDDSAYVIIVSADSIKDNILTAKKHGAKGFVVKPFTKAKLDSFFYKCPTIKSIKSA